MSTQMTIVNRDDFRAFVPQNKPKGDSGGSIPSLSQALLTSFGAAFEEVPAWPSKSRDNWMSRFWKEQGNDLLAGAVSTLVAKIASTNWYLEGPLEVVKNYRNILLHQSNFGLGWDQWITQWVEAYLARDMGGISVRHRTSAGDVTGPSLGFSHVDEEKCYLTGDPDWPVAYDTGKGLRKIRRQHVMRITDMVSGQERHKGFGFCSVSRAISTARILQMIVKYKKERLSDLPPAAILFISNLTETQWHDIVTKYDTRQRRQGNTVWRDLLTAFGHDPENPVTVDMFELSTLPEHYDEKIATEIAVYTFALSFRVDAREYWPVSAGPLGTATEAEIQHKKAKAKGEGIIFNTIEHQLNHPLSLPQAIKFRFDYRDDEEDMRAAQIAKDKIANIRKMWERSPNAPQFPEGVPEEQQPGRPNLEEQGQIRQVPEMDSRDPERMISTEEARILLAREGLIPSEWVLGNEGIERMYDVRSWGPRARIYRDGVVVPV